MEKIVTCEKLSSYLEKLEPIDDKLIINQVKSILEEDFTPKTFYKAEAVKDFVWEKLNTGHWSDVNIIWQQLFSIISVTKVLIIVKIAKKLNQELLKDLVKICDIGILMGAPILDSICSKLASHFCRQIPKNLTTTKTSKRLKLEYLLGKTKNVEPLKEIDQMTLEEFIKDFKLQTPVLIKNAVCDWPALEDWSVDFFKVNFGFRTIPVEIGKRYTDDSWTQTLMTLSEFITKFIEEKNESKGYLAQHELFQQIPELKEDFEMPIYCYTSENEDEISVNFWFGPENTVSPLHTDPKENCLTQIFGEKYVRLYPENQSHFLYPYQDLLSNTSRIDIENEFDKIVQDFPQFQEARGFECILNPGDILYIPPKCWHFVKSLSQSCSLSFWF